MMPGRGRLEWRMAYGVVVILVVAAFLYTLSPLLSPFALFLLLLLLLRPYAGTPQHLLLVTGTALLTLVWLLKATGSLLAPFILALVLSYILDPAVDLLQRRRVPRGLAIVLLGLPFVGLLVLALVFGIPALARQVEVLIARAPEALERMVRWAESARSWALTVDLPLVREDALLGQLREIDTARVVAFLQERQQEIVERGWNTVLGLGRGLGTLVTILGYVVLTPVLAFYLLRDWDGVTEQLRDLVPVHRREGVFTFIGEYDALLSRYLRGQVLAAATVGVLTWLLLWIFGFPYAGLVGAVAGVFNLIPYVGLVVSLIPAVLIALLSGSILVSLLKVAVVFVLVQLLDSTVLGPRIVGGSVGLHPVWVILALAVGGFFLGFVGLLLAMPTAVLLKLLIRYGVARYRRSSVFLGSTPPGAE